MDEYSSRKGRLVRGSGGGVRLVEKVRSGKGQGEDTTHPPQGPHHHTGLSQIYPPS